MKILFLLLLFVQQEESIKRSAKAPYARAWDICEGAIRQIESNPQEAILLLTEVLGNKKVKKRECRLRWEIVPGTYSPWHDFFPYQYRGRARQNLAGKTGDREKAVALLQGAEKDFQESIRRGLKSSETYLEQVQKEIEKQAKIDLPKVDLEPGFRKEWRKRLDNSQFQDAKTFVVSKGAFLSPERNKYYLRETDIECRRFLVGQTKRFLIQLEGILHPRDLKGVDPDVFQERFRLPQKSGLTILLPEYDWCLSVFQTIDQWREGSLRPDLFLDRALEAVPFLEKGEPRWFLSVERLAYTFIRGEIDTLVESSFDKKKAERERLLAEIGAWQKEWTRFENRLQKVVGEAFRKEVPGRDFQPLLASFPIDHKDLGKVMTQLLDCMDAENPVRAMKDLQNALFEVRKEWNRLSWESRVEIIQGQIAVASLLGFLNGDPTGEIVQKLQKNLGAELKELGGSFDVDLFGPKVQRVFDRLR